MQLNKVKNTYFIGIGGIGMSALARYCLKRGIVVYGYDKTETKLSKTLEAEGAKIVYQDTIDQVPEAFNHFSEQNLVIYTPAIPTNNLILNYLKNKGYNCIKRAQFLGWISENHFTIAVAGTHGKTTTSCLLALLIKEANFQFTAILGGISTNLESNFFHQPDGMLYKGQSILVTEADEFDKSFLHLSPNIAILTSTDADHLDIYKEESAIRKSYQEFIDLISEKCILNEKAEVTSTNCITYGKNADYSYKNIQLQNGNQHFDTKSKEKVISDIQAGLPGEHNIENATAVIAVADYLGVDPLTIKSSVENYKGVQRRFEKIVNLQEHIVIDDYAHHPSEINALIKSVRSLYPNQEITLIFQPHLYSRTQDFMDEFAAELSQAEDIIVMPIYPAREEPILGVTSDVLIEKINNSTKRLLNHNEVLEYIKIQKPKLLVVAGAGDINLLREPLKTIYNGR